MELKSKVQNRFWFENGGQSVAESYVSLLPDSELDVVYPHGRPDDPMVVEFTLAVAPTVILTVGPHHRHSPTPSWAPDDEAAARVQAAMMQMKKIDIAALEAAAAAY